MQIRKYLPAIALAALCAGMVLADASQPPDNFDLGALNLTATNMGNGLYSFYVDTLLPNVTNVLKGVAILVGLLLLWRWIRRGIGR